jgi:hypothetical protein
VAGQVNAALPPLPDAARRWPHARDADRRLRQTVPMPTAVSGGR